MKKLAFVLAFTAATLALGFAPRAARAEIGTADQVPAATLLLPYFEVKLDDATGVNTTFSINNATATAVLAHVTLWTDEGVPTFNYDVYLTGYDSQSVNLASLFNSGIVPVTADAGTDPTDTISPKGLLSQDINFPPSSAGTQGTCEVPYSNPELSAAELRHIRAAHTGRRSDVLNGCAGGTYGDLVARGYVTVDVVGTCTSVNATDPSYFTSITTQQNVLWGDYTITDEADNSESASSLVHIEACPGSTLYVGSDAAGLCPFASGDYTFYGRLNGFTATDNREPLATTFGTRFVNGGTFNGGTDVLVWRDNKVSPTGVNRKRNCKKSFSWFPLSQTDVVSWDETENPVDLCFLPDNVSPPIGGVQSCFPLVTQRVPLASGNPLGKPVNVPQSSGWIVLNLNHTLASGDPKPGIAQAWVESIQSASGRFGVGFQAIPFDNASYTNPGGVVYIP